MGSCFSFLGLSLPLLSPAKERDGSTSFKTRSQEYCCHSHPKQSRFGHLRRNRRKMETLRLHFTKESRESHNSHVVAKSLSRVQLFETPWTAACRASLSFTISLTLLRLKSIESVMPPLHLILCHPLLLPSSVFPSIRVFSNESVLCIRWPKDWSFSFSISPSNEYSGLISFRTDWFDFLAVQCTVKSLLQHHSSKASILQCSAFLMDQLSHPHMTTGKTIALTIGTFVSKVISLLHMQCAESVRSSEDLGHQSLVSLCGPAIKLSLLQHFGFFGLIVCQAHQGDLWKQGITRTVLLELSTQGLRINLGVPGAMPSIWSQSL